jgi:hypothetical protein
MVAPKEPSSDSPPATKVGEHIYLDIIILDGVSYGGYKFILFAVDEKSGAVTGLGCTAKNANTLFRSFKNITFWFNQFGHQVFRATFNDEPALRALKPLVSSIGVEPSYTPPGMHNKRAEIYIRTLKERKASIEASLPYKVSTELNAYLVLHVINDMNNVPNSLLAPRTPYELVSGRKPKMPQFKFGQTGIFHAVRAGDPAARGEMGIYIGQRGNHSKYYMG